MLHTHEVIGSSPIAPTTPSQSGPSRLLLGCGGGFLSNFAATPGLRLPFGYHGHHENDKVGVLTVEHWFQACKATSRQQFDLILTSGTAAIAKHAGRQTRLRPDWEQVKFQVMLCALRGNRIGMVFQEPMTALNPLHSIGDQVLMALVRSSADAFVSFGSGRDSRRKRSPIVLAFIGPMWDRWSAASGTSRWRATGR